MKEKPRALNQVISVAISAWIVAVQIWYYLQFSGSLRAAAATFVGRLWHLSR